MRNPGAQNPHCSASSLNIACCRGLRLISSERPSIVLISAPSALTASTMQEYTDLPFMITVHEPHSPRLQPVLVPTKPSFSRKTQARDQLDFKLAMNCVTPLTVKLVTEAAALGVSVTVDV